MKTKSLYAVAAIVGGHPIEFIRTPSPIMASATFIQTRFQLLEDGEPFLLVLSLVNETTDENGQMTSFSEYELDRTTEKELIKNGKNNR